MPKQASPGEVEKLANVSGEWLRQLFNAKGFFRPGLVLWTVVTSVALWKVPEKALLAIWNDLWGTWIILLLVAIYGDYFLQRAAARIEIRNAAHRDAEEKKLRADFNAFLTQVYQAPSSRQSVLRDPPDR